MSGNITLDKVSHYRVFYDIVKKITKELEIAFTAAKAIIDSEKE